MTPNQQIERWLASRKASFQSERRPLVTLSYAQSIDGSITTRCGEALSLSGAPATRLTHQLRSLHDGILVGIGTVLTDDPQLTVREWSGPNPQPIVLDSQLRMPPDAQLCRHPDKQCWILTNHTGHVEGLEILTLERDEQQRIPLAIALAVLRERGIESLMVEGGAGVITALLRARLADGLVLTIAPRLLGGYKAVSNLGAMAPAQLPQMDPLNCEKLGEDLIVWGDLHYGEPGP